MSHTRMPSLDGVDERLVADVPFGTTTSSMLYTILPGAVKHRLPAMPSLRRSFSSYTLRPSRPAAGALVQRPQSAGYGTRQLYPQHRQRQGDAAESRFATTNTPVGMGWKYANQGMVACPVPDAMLTSAGLALLESSAAESQYPDDGHRAFARRLYVHGLGYLLRGLPAELTEAEASSLQDSIPPSLHHRQRDGPCRPTGTDQPSVLHRLLATSIARLFLLTAFILPYIKLFLRSAYRYERTHRLSQRALATGLDAMDHIGKKGTGVADFILASGNGRLGSFIVGAVAWWVEGISGGIHQGLGEGMAIIGAPR
jgi:hypothetical protein